MVSSYVARIVPVVSIAAMFAAADASVAQNTAEKILIGDTNVTMIQSYSGKEKLPKPAQAIIYGFDVPPGVITIDHSVAAHILNNGPIAHIKGDAGQKSDPEVVAAKVQAAFSKRLVQELKKTSIPTGSAPSSANLDSSVNTLTVHGDFTAVQQGNEAARIMIGFGRGASDVKAHVVVSLITQGNAIVLAEFNLDSESGKKPAQPPRWASVRPQQAWEPAAQPTARQVSMGIPRAWPKLLPRRSKTSWSPNNGWLQSRRRTSPGRRRERNNDERFDRERCFRADGDLYHSGGSVRGQSENAETKTSGVR